MLSKPGIPTKRNVFIAALSLMTVLSAAGSARAADCSALDHRHAAWNDLLHRFVRDGSVDYARWKREGQEPLREYLGVLSGACAADYEKWSREQRLAFWINAYNAFTVKLILDNYPIASIRKIGWLPGAAFREEFIAMPGLKGGVVSLNTIEHDTLRKDFREPRIHFALVCAARSCPPLRSESYRAAELDGQLDDQTRRFLGDNHKNRFDAATQTLSLSMIFDWFRADFAAVADSLPAYVSQYMPAAEKIPAAVRVEFLEYDWSLNDSAGQS